MRNKLMAWGMIFLLLLPYAVSVSAAAAESNQSTISSVEDLIQFSKNCTYDRWSQGKTVVLTRDLDLSGTKFTCIGTFGGTFDGGGHIISGLSLKTPGSAQGLFRYIQSGGIVKNLSAKGSIAPTGTKKIVGGIAGSNAGTIQDCAFTGTVDGEESVGGIAGINLETGKILACSAGGSILGRKRTGGICGKNLGTIRHCSNAVSVNTSLRNDAKTTDDLNQNVNSTVEQFSLSQETNSNGRDSSTENRNDDFGSQTDAGGIAGYSSGILQGCSNSGTIGYPHVGYNVGGIAGRQAGYLLGCSNSGKIYGRKDVGGIVGQMEPYIILNMSSGTLDQMGTELDQLNSLIHTALDDIDDSNSSISKHLTKISGYSKSALDQTNDLTNQTSDFIDSNVGQINDLSTIVSNTLDKMVPMIDHMTSASKYTTSALKQIQSGLDSLSNASENGTRMIYNAKLAVKELEKANSDAEDAMKKTGAAIDKLNHAVVIEDRNAVQSALNDLSDAMGEMSEATRKSSEAISDLTGDLQNVKSWSDLMSHSEILSDLSGLSKALGDMSTAQAKISSDVSVITQNSKVNWSDVQAALKRLGAAMDDLESAAEHGNTAMSRVYASLDYAEKASGHLSDAFDDFSDAAGALAKVSKRMHSAISKIRDLIQKLSDDNPIQFSRLGDDYRRTSNDLCASLAGISDEMDPLNNTLSSSGKKLTQDLKNIGDQLNKVLHLLISTMKDMGNLQDNTDLSKYVKDISEEDIKDTTLGKVKDCKNTGLIQADRDAGGIAGVMGIEYSADPEDDLKKPTSLNFVYNTKAVMQNCVNQGKIIGKKDCIGGITGRMDLGTALGCENYGNAESTEGNYVGGIAGLSTVPILNSCAKCTLSGKNDIGGIAGSGKKIRKCYANVRISSEGECLGAVAGTDDSDSDQILNNYFIDRGIGGIDSISYCQHAEPIDFKKLLGIKEIPEEFISFVIQFKADGKTVETTQLEYGEPLSELPLPAVPEKSGYFGVWPAFTEKTVSSNIVLNAVYKPWVTVLDSREKKPGTPLSLALAEGQFTDSVSLHVAASQTKAPKEGNGEEKASVWDVSLKNSTLSEGETVPIRLLKEQNGTAAVWKYNGKSWERLDAVQEGKYLKLKMTGTQGTFCIQYSTHRIHWLQIAVLALLVSGLTAFVLFIKKRHGSKR
jgi:methyl-accepting chemotaxis protein